MVTPSIMVYFQPQSSKLTLMPKQLDKHLLMLKRNLMPGETDGLPTLVQSYPLSKANQDQTQLIMTITTKF